MMDPNHHGPGHQKFKISGVNPINGLQACIYKLANTSLLRVTLSHKSGQIQITHTRHLQIQAIKN